MKSDKIIPAVIPNSYEDIEEHAELVELSVKVIQIDLLDGLYTGSFSWPWHTKGRLDNALQTWVEKGLPKWENIDYEFDCMIVHPIQILPNLLPLGPRRIIVHAAALSDLENDIAYLQSIRDFTEIGIAVTINDDLQKYSALFAEFDYVQCMGISTLGMQGAQLDERVFALVKNVRSMTNQVIQVDGGVNAETIAQLQEAGANRFVSGSAVFEKGLVDENIAELEDALYEE